MKIIKTTARKEPQVASVPTIRAKVSMRDVANLIKINATPERVSDYTFRSTEELSYYLRGIDTDIAPVTASLDRNKLEIAYKDLCALQNKIDVLDSLSVTINYEFRKERTKIMPLFNEVRKRMEARRDKAMKLMQRAARKNEPEALIDAVASAQTILAKRFGRSYVNETDFVFVTAPDADSLCFSHYLQFNGLQNEFQDYTYPEYYVVLSAVVKDGANAIQLYLNTLHQFRAPGAFNIGTEFAVEGLADALSTLLTTDEFVDRADALDMGTFTLDSTKFKTPVSSVVIRKGEIVCELNGTRNECIERARALVPELQGALFRTLAGYVLKHKLVSRGKERFDACYVAVPGTEPARGLDAHAQSVLKDVLGLTAGQIHDIRRLILKGY